MPVVFLEEVFKRSGLPTHTFVEPREYPHLKVALRTAGRGVIIEGPSGIGKTTAVLTAISELGRTDLQKLSARIEEDVEYVRIIPDLVRMKHGAGLVMIDDFHRLPDDVKHTIADLMKEMADREDPYTKIILVGINKAGNSLVDFAPDLNNRIDTIRFESNPTEVVRQLIQKGEETLRVSISSADAIAADAGGSFHIAQILCHEICLLGGVTEQQSSETSIEISLEAVKDRVLNELARSFHKTAIKFARGPRFRRVGRAPYLHFLRWLADGGEGTLSMESAMVLHPDIQGSIRQIVDKGYLSRFLASNEDLQNIIHFDEYSSVLAIEDPKFIYFINNLLWSRFVKDAGYLTLEFKSRYDFALSFAGESRDIVEMILSHLRESEVEVFYDRDEQHRILASDVEAYLGPIYRTEASYVVVFLSPEYPRKIWTKFESDQFKFRFGENSIIPIWFSTSPPGVFDQTAKVGGMTFDPNGDVDRQALVIAETLTKKLEDDRRHHDLEVAETGNSEPAAVDGEELQAEMFSAS